MRRERTMYVEVYDKDMVGSDEFLGRADLNMDDLAGQERHSLLLELQPRPGDTADSKGAKYVQGQVEVRLTWTNTGEIRDEKKRREKILATTGGGPPELIARIHVRSARGLAKADTFGKSDPFAKLLLNGKEVGRTEVVSKDLNPVWSGGEFEVTLAIPDDLSLLATDGMDWGGTDLRVEVHDKVRRRVERRGRRGSVCVWVCVCVFYP